MLALALAVPLAATGAQTPQELVAQGQALETQGKYAEAIAKYTRALEADSKFSEAYRRRALATNATGDRRGAIADFTRAIDADPKNARAYNGRASSRMGLKEYAAAMQDLDSALTLDPAYSNAWANRGRIKGDWKGDNAGALADLTKSIELDPKNRVSYWARAEVKARMRDTTGAIADFNTVVSLDARDPAPLVLRGRLLASVGDAAGAARDFRGALSIRPDLAEAKDNLARLGEPQKVAALDASAAGRVMVSEMPPELVAAVEKYRTPARSRGPDVPWQAPSGAPVKLPTRALPSTMPASFDINHLTIEQFNGAVSTAMEQMRLLQGQMSPEDTRRFEKKWAPLFDAPTVEMIDYFNALNPVLQEFISVRTQIEMGAEEYRAGITAAAVSADIDDEEATRQALDVAAQQKAAIEAQQARLAQLLGRIQEIGNPPDPAASKRRARARHEQAMKLLADKPVYADFLGVWIGELLPLRPDPCPDCSQKSDLDPGAIILAFHEGTYQPGLHPEDKVAPGEKPSWDRPDLVMHHPQTGAITFLSGFGWTFTPIDYAMLAVKRLGVMWTDGEYTAGNWGSPPIFRFFDPKETYLHHLQVQGDEMTGLVPGKRGGDLYRLRVHRVVSEPAADPPGFDPDAIAARKQEMNAVAARANARDASPQERQQASDKLRGLSWQFQGHLNYAAEKRRVMHFLLNWKPTSAADLDDPGKAIEAGNYADYQQALARRLDEQAARVAAPAAAPPTPPAAPATPPTEPTLTPEQRAEEIADARLRILSLQKDVEFYRKQVNTLKDEQKEWATLNLKSKEADILQERDYIGYLQTGEYAHTRTPLDEWNFNRSIASAEQDALNAHITKQGTAALYKMVELADPAQKEELRAFINRQLTPQVLGGNDAVKIKQVMDAVSNQAMGYQQKLGAKADEEATDEEEKEYWTKTAVTALGVAVGGVGAQALVEAGVTGFALSAGTTGISAMYGAATGYVEGGPVQAVEQAAASTGLVAFGIIEGMKGYHEAVIDPSTGRPTGEVRGLWGAAERAGTAVAVGWMIGKGVQVASGAANSIANRISSQVAAANASGAMAVADYGKLRQQLSAATSRSAPKEEIAAINQALEKAAAEVDANYAAKSLLQKLQKTGSDADKFLAKDFRVRQKLINRKVDAQFEADRTAGNGGIHYEEWNGTAWVKRPLTFRDIRNASSGKKLNMDRDKAMIEHPLFAPGLDGKTRPVAQNWVYHPDGTPKMPKFRLVDGSGKRITMAKANEQLQATFNRSYTTVTGQDAAAASQTLTSSANTEAYTDLRWIRDLSDANSIRVLEATGAKSARDVATFKGFHSGDPALAPILKDRETARASAKEIKLRLLNTIKNMKNVSPAAKEQSLKHWQEMSDALDSYVEDPVSGYFKLRALTGKSLGETMADIGYAIEASVRFGKL